MKHNQSASPSWHTILLLVAAVVIVVIIALLLAQIDAFERRPDVSLNALPVVDLEATAAAGELTVIYLPGEVSPSAAAQLSPTQVTPAAEATKEAATECDVPLNWVQYDTRAGDTLPKLARAHGTSVYYLMKGNCLERPYLVTGQKLFLPISSPAQPRQAGNDPHPFTRSHAPFQPVMPSWPIATPSLPPSQ